MKIISKQDVYGLLYENSVLRGNNNQNIVIFDLDDTIVLTDAKIKVVDPKSGKIIKKMTPAEFNKYEQHPSHVLSFEDFENPEILNQGKIIYSTFRLLKKFYRRGIPIAIVTARSNSGMVKDFFHTKGIDIHRDLVIAVNDPQYGYTGPVEEKKQQAMLEIIDKGFKFVYFFDDHVKNLNAAKELEKLRDVSVSTVKV